MGHYGSERQLSHALRRAHRTSRSVNAKRLIVTYWPIRPPHLIRGDISDWETPGVLYRKTAMECSTEELEQEVWAQIKQHVNVNGAEVLRDDNLVRWFLDPDVVYPNPFGSA